MLSADFAKHFAAAVRVQRVKRKLTQEQLAEKAELSSKMVAFVERGERVPSIAVAHAIANGMELTLSKLVREAESLQARAKR